MFPIRKLLGSVVLVAVVAMNAEARNPFSESRAAHGNASASSWQMVPLSRTLFESGSISDAQLQTVAYRQVGPTAGEPPLPSGGAMPGPMPGDVARSGGAPPMSYGGEVGMPQGEYGGAPCDGCGAGDGSGECSGWDRGLRNMVLPNDQPCVRWYNIDAQFMLLTRETGAAPRQLASDGLAGAAVLDAGDFDFHEEPGIRLGWQTIIGPADALEVGYLGTFFWEDTGEAQSNNNNLFSAFSAFGTNPFGGFADLDGASIYRISYKSDLNSLELNYRRRWMSPNNRIENSFLMGVRYVRLEERFRFTGQTLGGTFDYEGKTENNDLGFQLGGDLFIKAFRGLSLGGEVKAGIYGNSAIGKTTFDATSIVPTFEESIHRTSVAFVSEGNFMALARVNSHLTMKAGYELLFLDRVALAPDNFNATTPGLGRVASISTRGEVFYHGFTGGFEWTW